MFAALAIVACTDSGGDKSSNAFPTQPSFAPLKGGANLDQWANGTPTTPAAWQNGNLNGNNSAYAEGKAVPFRLAIEGLTAGTHFITLQYDFTAGGHKAYDFLASLEATEPDALAKLCAAGGGGRSTLCGAASNTGAMPDAVSTMTKAFPPDDKVVDGLTVTGAMTDDGAARFLRIYGGTITEITAVSHAPNDDFSGNSTGEMLVKFTSTGSAVQLVWSGHLARSSYWNSNNPPDGAGEVSGAPWHMRTLNLDGGGAANQDRSIQPSAIVENPTLSIVKTGNPVGPISAGTNIGFDIVVTNNGPGTANSVVVTDVLPTGFEWEVSPTKAECSITAGTLTCNAGALAANASYTVHITSPTDTADCKAVDNTASANASNAAEVSDDASVTVQCPNLSIEKTADQGTVSAGTSIGFVITVTNGAGAGTATGVTVTDNLPTTAGLVWAIDAAGSSTGCSITAGVLTCNFGDIAPSTNKHVHVTSPTTSASCTTINNEASYTTSNNGTGKDDASVTVQCPSLTITKTADQGTVSAGTSIGFIITVANGAGAGTATGVTVTDALPGTAGLSWTVDAANSSTGCSIASGTLTCDFGTIAPNTNKHVHITSVTTSASCGTIDNTASYTTSNNGSGNDDASVNVQCAALDIQKTADQGTVSAGTSIGFVINLTNMGAGTATNVKITDDLPNNSGLNWQIDAANSDAGCSIASGKLTCDYGSLAGGASKKVHITSVTTSASCAVIDNKAVVTSDNSGGDESTASVTVQCPSLTITKTADQGTVSAGTSIGFVITVANGAGAGTATGVTVTDNLPGTAGLNWAIDAAGSSTGCSITAGVLTCNFGDIAPSTNKHVHITSPTTSASCTTINNEASYTTSNNGTGKDDASVVVQCPNLDLAKAADQGTVSAGTSIGFVITVTNGAGSGTATAVTVTDNLPTNAGLAWTVDAANSDAGCSITNKVLTCNFGDMAASSSKHVHVTSPTTSASCAVIDNTANVTSTNGGSDEASASVTVQCPNLSITKTADQGTVSAGTSIGFVITVANGAGAGTATGVTVTDALPGTAGLSWTIDAAGSSMGCSIAGGTLTCNFGDIAPSTNKHVHVTSPTTSASCTTINNEASYTTSNNGTGKDDASVTVQCPSLKITKTPTSASVKQGGKAEYTIVVTNEGPGTAVNVQVADTLPDGLTWAADDANCSVKPYSAGGKDRVLDCPKAGGTAITLGSGDSYTVKVSALIPADFIQPEDGPAGTPLEIDGNLDDAGGTPGKDWNSLTIGSPALPLNCTMGALVGCRPDLPTGSTDNAFGEGTKEDDTTPTIVAGSIPNNKSDLKRFYLASERIVANDFLYFAWERVQAPTGTTNMDIELNKLPPVAPATLSQRSAGDILIKYDLAQGGTNPVLGFHKWVASGPKSLCYSANSTPCWGALQSLAGNPNVAAAINTVGVTDNIPPVQPTLDALTFGEARINLQGAGIFPPNQCVSFGAAFLKSRSSDSFTAAVKDFIAPLLINLSNCPPVDLKNTAFTRASNYQANAWVASLEAKITVTIASASTVLETTNGQQLAWTAGRSGFATSSAVAAVSSIEAQPRGGEGRQPSANARPNVPAIVAADGRFGRGLLMPNRHA